MRLSARMTIALVIALVAIPVGLAEARNFKGTTSQGGGMLLKTNANRVPVFINIGWRAYCAGGRGSVPSSTVIRAPFDAYDGPTFYNSGKYSYRGRRGSRNYVKTRIKGRRVGARRWKGIFRVRITIKRRGKTLYRCRSHAFHWRVKR